MEFYNNKISLAFDVYGCPQKCAHCRAATDLDYLPWCRERGIEEAQFKLFGNRETTIRMIDYPQAYDYTKRVIGELRRNGIKPKIQLYLTSGSLEGLGEVLDDLSTMEEFEPDDIHIKLPNSVGKGYELNGSRLRVGDGTEQFRLLKASITHDLLSRTKVADYEYQLFEDENDSLDLLVETGLNGMV